MSDNIRPETMERITTPELAKAFIDEQLTLIKEQVGDRKVLLALSGGVDSSVVAALLIKAIGRQLVCVHVNHGLLRKGEPEQVIEVFRNQMNADLVYVDAADRFLEKLSGVDEPEEKRKIIGGEFIEVFAEEARKLNDIKFLGQGTIYPDILESDGVKAHHNVGGLPEDMDFELVEPIKLLYKDEVRVIGRELGLPDDMVDRQPFPGPGLGVRCTGAITRERLEAVRESDSILREEFARAGADIISIHAEATPHIHGALQKIRTAGVKASVVINPGTPVEAVKNVLNLVDQVLVMTVNPGFGGQAFLPETMDKVRELVVLREVNQLDFDIEVDGGIDDETIGIAKEAGANVFVAGSYVFKGDVAHQVQTLKEALHD